MRLPPYLTPAIVLILIWVCMPGRMLSQNTYGSEVWVGYISSIRISEKYSIWNDFHYVPTAFWANRHGLTRDFGRFGRFTGGYAYVVTATGFSEVLNRREHRPWWQHELTSTFREHWGWRARLRYDRRIREAVSASDFTGEWLAYNRWRVMLGLSYTFRYLPEGRSWQLHLLNELLLNNGKQFEGNTLDQNRTYIMLGYQKPGLRIQFGPHVRAIPTAVGYNYRFGAALWIIQSIDGRAWLGWPW